jgi:monoamine oxidase
MQHTNNNPNIPRNTDIVIVGAGMAGQWQCSLLHQISAQLP